MVTLQAKDMNNFQDLLDSFSNLPDEETASSETAGL